MNDPVRCLELAETYLSEVDLNIKNLHETGDQGQASEYLRNVDLAWRQIGLAEEENPDATFNDIGIDGFKAWALLNRGIVKNIGLGKRVEALQDLEASLEHKELSTARWGIGLINADMGQKDAAIYNLQKAVELEPDSVQYRRDLDEIEQTSALALHMKSFQGSWKVLGVLSFLTIFALIMMLGSGFSEGKFFFFLLAIITIIYVARKTSR